jgi:hypothetical protein
VGWAGNVLLAYEELEGGYVRTLAFDGPGESRLLSDGGMVVAISPDGTEVLLVEGEIPTHFVVEDVSDGSVLWSGEVDTALGPLSGSYANDWEGDRIAVAGALGDGSDHPYLPGLALLTFRGGALTLERLVVVPTEADYMGLSLARFTSDGEVRVRVATMSGNDVYEYWQMVCDPGSAACRPVTAPDYVNLGAAEVNNRSGGLQP